MSHCALMRPTFIVSLCLMQDDFTRQGDSTVPQWVNLNKKMQFAFSALKTRVATRDQKCKQIPRVRTSLNCSNIQQSIFNMVATKRCAWGTSKNDSRYPQRMIKNSNGDLVTFFHFPGPKKNAGKRMRWIVHVAARW